jgi:hypothetical protein
MRRDDETLVDELRRVVGDADPVPPHVLEAGELAFSWRTIDDEIAQLLHDSSEQPDLAGVRADAGPRVLEFGGAGATVELEVAGEGAERTLTGQLDPPAPARIEVRHPGGTIEVDADARGRFIARAVPAGTVSLRCLLGPRALATPWLPL